MLKLNKITLLLLEKITTKKFYVISKFKSQDCLGEYKKKTYKINFTSTFIHVGIVVDRKDKQKTG